MSVMKIGMIGVLGVLLALQFKSEKTEYGLYIGVTICLLIFWFCMEQMVHLVGKVEALSQYLKGSESYILYLVKAVGITYLCNFSSLVCKDAGFGAVAGQIPGVW